MSTENKTQPTTTTTTSKKDFLTGLGIAGGVISLPIIAFGVLFFLCCCCCMFFSLAGSTSP